MTNNSPFSTEKNDIDSETEPKEMDLDTLLMLIENPIRRKILSKLATETHYPLQLSKELNVSQQAIMKHLKVMHENGLVRSFEEKSTSGGPPRKCYVPTKYFSMRIDIGPNTFDAHMQTIESDCQTAQTTLLFEDINNKLADAMAIDDPHDRLAQLSKTVEKINKDIKKLESERNALMQIREHILREIYAIIGEMSSDYEERKVLYYVIRRNDRSPESISEALDMRMVVLQRLFKQLEDEKLLLL